MQNSPSGRTHVPERLPLRHVFADDPVIFAGPEIPASPSQASCAILTSSQPSSQPSRHSICRPTVMRMKEKKKSTLETKKARNKS